MCEIGVKSKHFQNQDHFANSFSRMYELMLQQKICDATLVLCNKKVKVHKIILAGCSNFFKELFFKTEDEYVIDLVDNESVRRVLEYCYTGIIDINRNDMVEILSAASLFQLEPLMEACFDFMKANINDENCLNILNQSQLNSATLLENLVMDYVQLRFKKISTSSSFMKLEMIQFKKIMKNDYLNVSSENDIFECVKKWVMYDEKKRKQHILSLMECVRMPLLTTEILLQEVQPFCGSILQCNTMVTQALGWKLLSSKTKVSNGTNKPRKTKNTILIFGCYSENKKAEIYNSVKNEWTVFLDTNVTRRNFGVVLVNDSFIIIGGYSGQQVVNVVEKVDVNTGEKLVLPPMQIARAHMAAVFINGYVYVPGGTSEEKRELPPISSMERFHVKSNKWSYSVPMLTPRHCFDIAVIGKEFYVVGGWSVDTACDTTEAFCTITEKWRSCAPMVTKRCWPGVTAINDCLYVIGGRQDYNYISTTYSSLEMYNSKNDAWTLVANLKMPLYAICAGYLGDKVVAIGGSSAQTSLVTDVEEYDPENRSWKVLAPILSRREVTNAFSVPLSWVK